MSKTVDDSDIKGGEMTSLISFMRHIDNSMDVMSDRSEFGFE